MKRILCVALFAAAVLSFAPKAADAGEWKEQAGYWYYQDGGNWYYQDGPNWYWWHNGQWEFYAPWSAGYNSGNDGYYTYGYSDGYPNYYGYYYPYRTYRYGPVLRFDFGRDGFGRGRGWDGGRGGGSGRAGGGRGGRR